MTEPPKSFPRWRPVTVLALLLSAAYFIGISLYLSSQRMMWGDEFIAWYVITDPSWRHALESWNQAADSGGPLFYIIGRSLVSLAGPHPLVMRLFSAACLWMSAVLWFDLLRRKFSVPPALFACALVWLCDALFVYHMGEVRFYGQLVLAVTVAAAAMIWMEDRRPKAGICFALMFGVSAFLITSHMLGVMYSAFFIATLIVSRLPVRRRTAALGGALCSWSLILLFRQAMKAGAEAYSWVDMPHAMDLLRFYLHTPVYFARHPAFSLLVNMSFELVIIYGAVLALRGKQGTWEQDHGRRLLLIFSGWLLLLPLGLYLLSHLYKPVWVARYMMPYDLGLACWGACAVWLIGRQTYVAALPWRRSAIMVAACLLVAVLHAFTMRYQPRRPYSDIEPFLSRHPSVPVILEDSDLFLASRFYGGKRGDQIFFVMPQLGGDRQGTFDAVHRQGYQPGLLYDEEFLRNHASFFYIDIPIAHEFFLVRETARHPAWRVNPAGSIWYRGVNTPLLKIEQLAAVR